MIKMAIGYAKQPIEAKERALLLYDQIEGKKTFKFVESHFGYNDLGESAWITTIWFEVIELTPEEKEDEKYHFIGSTEIDPNDPNWYEKWSALQKDSNDQAESMAHIVDK